MDRGCPILKENMSIMSFHDPKVIADMTVVALIAPAAAPTTRPVTTHLTYLEQLHVWTVGLRLGIFGQINSTEYALLMDRDVAVVELNNACDAVVTERSLRTIVLAFQFRLPPYPLSEPIKCKPSETRAAPASAIRLKTNKRPTHLTTAEINELGPHLQGLVSESMDREAARLKRAD